LLISRTSLFHHRLFHRPTLNHIIYAQHHEGHHCLRSDPRRYRSRGLVFANKCREAIQAVHMWRSMSLVLTVGVGQLTCDQEQCLNGTSGLFDGIPPSNLTALCGLDQSEVTRYVGIMQPCLGTIKNANGGPVCTAGGVWGEPLYS
jgi:hypothetical protein